MTVRSLPSRRVQRGAPLVVALFLCAADGHAAPDTGTADSGAMIVTSDSGAYCHTLSNVIETHGKLPREVRELKAEGDGLCSEGRVRGGIARLRRALLVLHKSAMAPVRP